MDNPSFRLEGIVREKDSMQDFEGPLSLILMLLQKNKIEIRDLSVSDILDQYLEYLSRMQSMDLEIASEFVQMASHLLYLKTRTLLTTEASSEKGLLYLTKQPEPLQTKKREYDYRHEPVDLLKAMLLVWNRGTPTPMTEERLFAVMPRRIVYSVRTKGMEILNSLRSGPQSLSHLYGRCSSGSEIVATFVAVLELCKSGNLMIERVEEQIVLQFTGSESDFEQILENFEEED